MLSVTFSKLSFLLSDYWSLPSTAFRHLSYCQFPSVHGVQYGSLNLSFLWATPLYGHPRLFIFFFRATYSWQHFFDNIASRYYGINTEMNSCGKVIFFIFRRFKNNVTCFFMNNSFIWNTRLMIWIEIITILSIKRSQERNKHSK